MSPSHKTGKTGILFLGGAKRVAIGRMFASACADLGCECEITGYELDPKSPLAALGHVERGLRWSDPRIFESLDRVVDERGISIVVPFVDQAVGLAARYAASRRGVFAPVSEPELCDMVFDKCAAADLFASLSLPIPATYRSGEPMHGLIAKPRHGSASKGIIIIDSVADMAAIAGKPEDYLIQQRIDRHEEITVDCYASVADGTLLAVSPRVRIEVSGGEAVRTLTVDDAEAIELASRTIAATGLRGAITVQLIRDLDTRRLMIMEINPRLGGGAVASVHAGADIPALIVAEALGLDLKPQRAEPGVLVTRYLEDVVFYPDRQ